MGIADHFLQEFQDMYQFEIIQYNSDQRVVNPDNVLYSSNRQ